MTLYLPSCWNKKHKGLLIMDLIPCFQIPIYLMHWQQFHQLPLKFTSKKSVVFDRHIKETPPVLSGSVRSLLFYTFVFLADFITNVLLSVLKRFQIQIMISPCCRCTQKCVMCPYCLPTIPLVGRLLGSGHEPMTLKAVRFYLNQQSFSGL